MTETNFTKRILAALLRPSDCTEDLGLQYEMYLLLASDGNGFDITNGEPLKSYEEWKGVES